MPALKKQSLRDDSFDEDRATDSSYTIQQLLEQSYLKLDQVDARLLLQHVLQVNHAYLITHAEEALSRLHTEHFLNLVSQRYTGVPVAYLTGICGFFDLTFKVSPAVLIPRPETELLVETVLTNIPESLPCDILDLGTGSGAIGITIAKHRPKARVSAVDISIEAIDIAKRNAQNLGVDNIDFIQSDWYDSLDTEVQFDWIVANPPYVAENDPHLQQGDLRFEPDIALSTHSNGAACIQHIISNASGYLARGGYLLLEHGYDQSAYCQQLLKSNGFQNILSYKDLAGIDRACSGNTTHIPAISANQNKNDESY